MGKGALATGRTLRRKKPIQEQAAGVSASRSYPTQTQQDAATIASFPLPTKPSWIRGNIGSILPELRTKWTEMFLSGPYLLMKVHFGFNLEVTLPVSGGTLKMLRPQHEPSTYPILTKLQWRFPHSVMLWTSTPCPGVGTFLTSTRVTTAVYPEILDQFVLPFTDQLYGEVDFIFQQDRYPGMTKTLQGIYELFLKRGRCKQPEPRLVVSTPLYCTH